MDPLIVEAMKKAAVAWIAVDGYPATAVWLMWHEDAAYLVHGGPEQPVPGLAAGVGCAVSVRGEHGGRILTWPAAVERVAPETPEWESVVPQLAQKRLNATDPVGAPARWATNAQVSRLTPTGEPTQAGATLPDSSGAAPPRPSTATTFTPQPHVLGRRRKA